MRYRYRLLMLVVTAVLFSPISPQWLNVKADSGQMVVLASGQRDPSGIAISNGYVYWTGEDGYVGAIRKVPVGGGGNVTIIAKAGSVPLGIAVDGEYVYWTDFQVGTVNRVRTDGGSTTVLASNQDHPWTILVNNGYVYWAESLVGNIKRVPVDGTGPIEEVVKRRVGVSGFAIGNGYLYWAEGSWQGADVSRIGRVSLPAGEPTLFVKTVKPWAITIRGGYLFWTEYRWGGVFKAPLTGGSIDTIKAPNTPNDDFMITSDDKNVYWTDTLSGSVQSAPLSGDTVSTLASNRTEPYDIASDGAQVVWTEKSGGNVMLYHLHQETGGGVLLTAVTAGAVVLILVSVVAFKYHRRPKKEANS